MSVALIDADVLCYRAAAVSHNHVTWDDDGEVLMENKPMVKEVVEDVVDKWAKAAKTKKHALVFSDRSQQTFRYDVCPIYKAKRPAEKPPLHDFVYDYLLNAPHHQQIVFPGLEGDDTLGLMATGENGSRYVIVSIDKDMWTIPARVCNPDADRPKVEKLSKRVADYNWMYQTITGDVVDNYKGAPGAGDVRATKTLAMCKSLDHMWSQVVDVYQDQWEKPAFKKKFLTEDPFDEALMNARCARILRHGDYDYEADKVRLWHPDEGDEVWISP